MKEIGNVNIELWDYRLKNQFQGGITLALKVWCTALLRVRWCEKGLCG